MQNFVRTHQEFERDEREKRWNEIKADPQQMARIGWDPTATKRTMRESTIAVFNEADTSKDGALQWPEFVNAASIMLKSKNMEDLVDSLEEFIKHEFDSHDVDESLSLDHVRSSRPRRSLIRATWPARACPDAG